MNGVEAIFFGIGVYLIATISPGPATLAIMAVAARMGRGAGLRLASGIVCGSLFWGLCAALGLATVMAQFEGFFVLLKMGGGAYLLWLAFKAFRSTLTKKPPVQGAVVANKGSYFLQGLAIHLTNPKAILAWVAILAIGVQDGAPLWHSFAMFGGCAVLGICVFFGYALLFSTTRAQMIYAKAQRLFEVTFGVAFGAAGIMLLTDRS